MQGLTYSVAFESVAIDGTTSPMKTIVLTSAEFEA